MSDSPDDFQDRIQRIMNEYKRQELIDKYGGQLSPESNPDLPPEVEAQWLDQIDEFERQFENADRITVNDFIGSPGIRPVDDIAPIDMEAALDGLLDILGENGIYIDFLHDIDAAEAYRFITEELLQEEIDDIRIPGLQQHFIYEEFHPNDADDAIFWAEDFLDNFFSNDEEMLKVALGSRELLDPQGASITLAEMRQYLSTLRAGLGITSNFRADPQKCEVEGDYATVEMAVSWDREIREIDDAVTIDGKATLRLKRSPHTGWNVIQVKLHPTGKL
ncbi:MAG: hypothetical protein JXB30_01720 [Anaerolineae bacterium]|nr:hypothetical protein [Anaerolineae bacterium]